MKWVTRERPKIDRIACPWLILRFVDPFATFLFVKASEVVGIGEKFGAAPFDIEGAFWSHRGEKCTFDVMLEEFGLSTKPLLRLAAIVRGADTARLDLAPEIIGQHRRDLGQRVVRRGRQAPVVRAPGHPARAEDQRLELFDREHERREREPRPQHVAQTRLPLDARPLPAQRGDVAVERARRDVELHRQRLARDRAPVASQNLQQLEKPFGA